MEKIMEKLRILSDSAKYDVSCASSGTQRSNKGGMGNAAGMGICHSWSADGRCISLLKVLFTNRCCYDCQYCPNRSSANVERSGFEPEELAELVIEFYRRNYIEGLFLSSGVERSPDYTTERIIRALQILRIEKGFMGYIHAKVIPGTSKELVARLGLLADRLSVNIEMPTGKDLQMLAPQKKIEDIIKPMHQIRDTILDRKLIGKGSPNFYETQYENQNEGSYLDGMQDASSIYGIAKKDSFVQGNGQLEKARSNSYVEKFAPAGQSTQMIIGATPENDRRIIKTSEGLYNMFKLKRVYYSAYIPVGNTQSGLLPGAFSLPPLRRENRLYQADWLLRFYKFNADEILDDKNPFLDLDLDPKIAWALRNIGRFPMEINRASYEELLRIPGVGMVSAQRIMRQRRIASIKYDDLKKLGIVVKRAQYFMTISGKYYGSSAIDPDLIRKILVPENPQLSMFTGKEMILHA
ncbi:MAG: putative DNA modification/repair radical SAM protein [Eubacteriales bacterium]